MPKNVTGQNRSSRAFKPEQADDGYVYIDKPRESEKRIEANPPFRPYLERVRRFGIRLMAWSSFIFYSYYELMYRNNSCSFGCISLRAYITWMSKSKRCY